MTWARTVIAAVCGLALALVTGCTTTDGGAAPDAGVGPNDAATHGDAGADSAEPLRADAAVSGPTVISASAVTRTEHEANLAVAPDGHVAVTWTGIGTASLNVHYRISLDHGETWGEPAGLPLPSDNNVASNASLWAREDGTLFVVWASEQVDARRNRTNVRVWLASAVAGATTFGAPSLVTEPGSPLAVDLPDLLVRDDGSFLVTYTSFATVTGDMQIVAARSTDGVAWTRSAVTDADPPAPYGFARTCASAGRTYLVYTDHSTGIFLRTSDDGGASWPGPRVTVQQPTEPDFFPALGAGCVARGDEVWVMYLRTRDFASAQPLYTHVQLAHSSDRGATLDATYSVADAAAGSAFLAPTMALSSEGALDVAYYAGNGDGDEAASFRHARSVDGGRTFAPSSLIDAPLAMGTSRSSSVWAGDYVGLEVVRGTLYAAFCETQTSSAHIAFYRTSAP